jgi:tRNA pseudouridine38-40 synthase
VVLRPDSGVVPVTVAGRTDAGVHAWGQVASYDHEAVDPRRLNALLPPDVAVLDCNPAPAGFDARRDATSRAYCYRVLARGARSALLAGRVLHWPHRVDLRSLDACAAALVGEHDFTAFTPTETEHVRFERTVLAAFWRRSTADDGVLELWIEADSFMRHMNRILVGTMLEVAGTRRTHASFAALLSGRPRSEAGPTAPAHGLYLAGVGYGGERVLQTPDGLRAART